MHIEDFARHATRADAIACFNEASRKNKYAVLELAQEFKGVANADTSDLEHALSEKGMSAEEIHEILGLPAREPRLLIRAAEDLMAASVFGDEAEAFVEEAPKPKLSEQTLSKIELIAAAMKISVDDAKKWVPLHECDIETLPNPRFLIDRLIPSVGVGVIYGDSRSKKSFIMFDIAMHLAHCLDTYHGDKIAKKDGGRKTLYLAGEGAGGFKTRARAWRKKHGVKGTENENFHLLKMCPNFLDADDMKRLQILIDVVMGGELDVLVIDTFARATPGADENATVQTGLFMTVVGQIAAKYDCVVLFLHHAAKSGDMRGSTAIRGAVDFAHKLVSPPGTLDIKLFCDKMKDGGPDGWETVYEAEEHEVGVNEDGKVMTSLSIRRKPEEGKKDEKSRKGEKPEPEVQASPEVIRVVADQLNAFAESGAPTSLTDMVRDVTKCTTLKTPEVKAACDFLKRAGAAWKGKTKSGASGVIVNFDKLEEALAETADQS